MRKLVRHRRLELFAAQRPECAERDGQRRARGTAAHREESREPVVDEVELRRSHAELGRDLVRAGA